MKNKIFFGSAIVAFCSLAFYMTNVNRIKNTKLEVYGEKSEQVVKKNTAKKSSTKSSAKSQKSVEKKQTLDVVVAQNSNQKISQAIKASLKDQKQAYQVSYLDLDKSSNFAQVTNTSQNSLRADNVLKLYLLLAYENAIKSKKLVASQSYQIKSSDQVGKKDPMLQTGIQYSYTYIRNMMINHDSDVAANILLKKLGKKAVNQVTNKFGAKNTKIDGKFGTNKVGYTSANDLVKVIKALYQGKVLGIMHDTKVIGYLASSQNKGLASKISGTSYKLGGSHGSVALVEVNGKNYVMACLNEKNNFNYAALGKAINIAAHKK